MLETIRHHGLVYEFSMFREAGDGFSSRSRRRTSPVLIDDPRSLTRRPRGQPLLPHNLFASSATSSSPAVLLFYPPLFLSGRPARRYGEIGSTFRRESILIWIRVCVVRDHMKNMSYDRMPNTERETRGEISVASPTRGFLARRGQRG